MFPSIFTRLSGRGRKRWGVVRKRVPRSRLRYNEKQTVFMQEQIAENKAHYLSELAKESALFLPVTRAV